MAAPPKQRPLTVQRLQAGDSDGMCHGIIPFAAGGIDSGGSAEPDPPTAGEGLAATSVKCDHRKRRFQHGRKFYIIPLFLPPSTRMGVVLMFKFLRSRVEPHTTPYRVLMLCMPPISIIVDRTPTQSSKHEKPT